MHKHSQLIESHSRNRWLVDIAQTKHFFTSSAILFLRTCSNVQLKRPFLVLLIRLNLYSLGQPHFNYCVPISLSFFLCLVRIVEEPVQDTFSSNHQHCRSSWWYSLRSFSNAICWSLRVSAYMSVISIHSFITCVLSQLQLSS